jgi:hypothetical protein
MRRHLSLLLFCLTGAVALSACIRFDSAIGVPLRSKTRFESEWQHYLDLPDHKSLAVAGDRKGVYASGVAYGYPSQRRADAVADALRHCEERRRDRSVDDECRTYAIDGEPVGAEVERGAGSGR